MRSSSLEISQFPQLIQYQPYQGMFFAPSLRQLAKSHQAAASQQLDAT